MYHYNSPYGKVEAVVNSNICFCRSSKMRNKPFCLNYLDDLKDRGFSTNSLYRTGENGLEAILDALNELKLKLKD